MLICRAAACRIFLQSRKCLSVRTWQSPLLKFMRLVGPRLNNIRQVSGSSKNSLVDNLGTVHNSVFQAGKNNLQTDKYVGFSNNSGNSQISKEADLVFDEIIDGLKSAGHVVVIPAAKAANTPIECLLNCGVNSQMVVDLFVAKPKLLAISSEDWDLKIRFFVESGFELEHTVEILAKNSAILTADERDLINLIQTLKNHGVKGERLPHLVMRCPEVLTELTERQIHEMALNLKNFFSNDQLTYLIHWYPEILFQNFEDLEAKYEYVFFRMGMEAPQLKKTGKWITNPIFLIQVRHEFLVRTGSYLKPNPKRPLLAKDNPNFAQILDSSEKYLAEKLGGVSLQEFLVFKDLFSRQLKWEKKNEVDEFLDESEIDDEFLDLDAKQRPQPHVERDNEFRKKWRSH